MYTLGRLPGASRPPHVPRLRGLEALATPPPLVYTPFCRLEPHRPPGQHVQQVCYVRHVQPGCGAGVYPGG